ncbi:MAG TPA: universal stress protein [Cyclobacteriaceae bacterium]|nr:universal stress protein [Cyclobacteriaceae bacterium]
MKKIIVPCDFSAPALEAVKFAANIARKSKGEVTIFHTIALPTLYNPSVVMAFEAEYMKDTKEASLKELEKVRSKQVGANVRTKMEVEFGDLLLHLKEKIKKGKFDLVVMGTHGASGLKEYTIGSNAEKVVRNSMIPVICVKKSPSQVSNIVFPVKPDMDQEKLTVEVKNLQNFFGAKLHVVFINTPGLFKRDSDTMPQLENFAKRFMLKNYTLNIFGDIDEEEGIINFTRNIKGDMVVMRTHGRKGLAHLGSGSIAEDVVNHIECPIWTLKIK